MTFQLSGIRETGNKAGMGPLASTISSGKFALLAVSTPESLFVVFMQPKKGISGSNIVKLPVTDHNGLIAWLLLGWTFQKVFIC